MILINNDRYPSQSERDITLTVVRTQTHTYIEYRERRNSQDKCSILRTQTPTTTRKFSAVLFLLTIIKYFTRKQARVEI